MSLLSHLTSFKPIIFFISMRVHIMHKWHNVEVNPIPFSDVATTKPRRDQLKLPVMIHSFHFSRHRWRHAVNNLSPAIRANWFESWTFKNNMFWIFSDAAITYTTHLMALFIFRHIFFLTNVLGGLLDVTLFFAIFIIKLLYKNCYITVGGSYRDVKIV